MNRRMNAERGVTKLDPVCSNVAGIFCIISKERALCKTGPLPSPDECRPLKSCCLVILV